MATLAVLGLPAAGIDGDTLLRAAFGNNLYDRVREYIRRVTYEQPTEITPRRIAVCVGAVMGVAATRQSASLCQFISIGVTLTDEQATISQASSDDAIASATRFLSDIHAVEVARLPGGAPRPFISNYVS